MFLDYDGAESYGQSECIIYCLARVPAVIWNQRRLRKCLSAKAHKVFCVVIKAVDALSKARVPASCTSISVMGFQDLQNNALSCFYSPNLSLVYDPKPWNYPLLIAFVDENPIKTRKRHSSPHFSFKKTIIKRCELSIINHFKELT